MFAINCKTKPLTPYQPTRDGSVREEEMLKMVVLFYICYSCINVILGCFPFCVLYFLPFSSLYPSAFSLYFPLNVSLRRFKNHSCIILKLFERQKKYFWVGSWSDGTVKSVTALLEIALCDLNSIQFHLCCACLCCITAPD